MATVKQIQFRLRLAKKKLATLNKDTTGTKSKIKKLETQLKQAQAAAKASNVKKKKPVAKKKAAPKKKATPKKKAAPKKK